jgi:recombinational DNA repair protein (RecF pathway)
MENCCGLVLARESTGEHFQKLTLLTVEHGLQVALMRKSNGQSAMVPDLFDTAEFSLEIPKGTGAQFIKQYRVVHREPNLGKDYTRFMAACRFAIILTKNSMPAESTNDVYALCQKSLNAFAQRPRPDATLFKALWQLARKEGFAVREHWLAHLSTAEQKNATAILNQTLDTQETPINTVEHLTRHLEQWLSNECHFVIGRP